MKKFIIKNLPIISVIAWFLVVGIVAYLLS